MTRCLTPRPHNSGEAPYSFTMAPCVVVERLEGKQQCSRAPVGEHAEVEAQDAECGCHEQQEVYMTLERLYDAGKFLKFQKMCTHDRED